MLKSLYIKNYALIKELDFEPDSYLNIVTGETGAGKSIMLGALGLLMGNRADVKALFDESQKCVVEGTFDVEQLQLDHFFADKEIDYEPQAIIRREIAPNGKSRAFVNDQPVTLDILKELGENLLDIHSQHDTLLLGSNAFQLRLLDLYAQNQEIQADFKAKFQEYKRAEKEYKTLQTKAGQLQKEFDYNSFLLQELEESRLGDLHQEGLEAELQILENAEEIKRVLGQSFEFLNHPEMPALGLLKDVSSVLASIGKHSSKYLDLKERIATVLIELQDISDELEKEIQLVESDESRRGEVNDLLNNLNRLQKKHGVTSVSELLILEKSLKEKVEIVLNLSGELEKLESKKIEFERLAIAAAQDLSISRNENALILATEIKSLLEDLGMPNALFEVSLSNQELNTDGLDQIAFKFTANKGSEPKTLREVASGGEFSRLMLALKYVLAKKTNLPTIIFDEIDTGISGQIAVKVGDLLQEMGQNMQVIAITHLPQIAGKGQSHYYIFKEDLGEKTISKMRKLKMEERVKEIAVMIGGENPTESAIKSARELLHN